MTNTTDPARWDFVPSSMATMHAEPEPLDQLDIALEMERRAIAATFTRAREHAARWTPTEHPTTRSTQ